MEISKFEWTVVLAALLGGFGVACGDAGNDGNESGVEPEQMQLGVAEQAFAEVACGRESVTPHLSVNHSLGEGIISPTSYNKCTKTFIVDLHDLDVSETGTGTAHDAGFTVVDNGPIPSGSEECNGVVSGIIVYERVNSRWEVLARHQSSGFSTSGSPGFCFPPQSAYFGVEAGKTYRIAATVRDINDDTRSLRIEHVAAADLPPTPR